MFRRRRAGPLKQTLPNSPPPPHRAAPQIAGYVVTVSCYLAFAIEDDVFYTDVGEGFGRLAAFLLAASTLPVTRNSLWRAPAGSTPYPLPARRVSRAARLRRLSPPASLALSRPAFASSTRPRAGST